MSRILLHICCGPCSIMPAQRLLAEGYEITGFFFNPNIQPLSEYLKRHEGAEQCSRRLGIDIFFNEGWNLSKWLECAPKETPARCEWCIGMRLEHTARHAVAAAYKGFSTSLLYSRYQPHDYIREKGEALAADYGIEFVYRDFRDYWQEGIDISREWKIYRQAWCGCIFSEAERFAKKLARLRAAMQPLP